MSNLTTYIKSINAKSKAKMNANPNLWIGMIVEDPKHWAEYKIYTPAQFDRYQDEMTLYELASSAISKSFARNLNIWGMSDAELSKEIDYYAEASERKFKEEKELEQKNIKEFESRIKHTISSGATDRKNAIRWILDGEGLLNERDPGYVCYSLGLPYSWEKEFKEIA